MKPKITVIAPVYNVEEYLEKSVSSILKQTLKDIEVILVDDGSSDASGAIIDDFAAKDNRIIGLHQVNAGAAAARNTGIKRDQGKYLYFLDPDDWLEKTMLQKMYEFAEEHQLQLSIAGFVNEYYEKGKAFSVKNVMPRRIFTTQNDFRLHAHEYLNNTFLAVPWNKLYKTSYLKNHHLEFPQVKWDDLHFNMEVIRNIERVGVLDIAEYHFFRSRPGSETTKVFNEKLFANRIQQFKHILAVYDDWKISDKAILMYVYNYYALRMIQLTQEIADNNMHISQKKSYVKKVLADSLTQSAFKKGKSNKGLIGLFMIPYRLRMAKTVLAIGKVISFVKAHFSVLFYRARIHVQKSKE